MRQVVTVIDVARRLAWLGCLVVVLGLPRMAHAEQRFALVIGANPGWSQDRPLRHAEHDAERIRDVLVSLGSFDRDRVELLRDPDGADVRRSLDRLTSTLRKVTETTVVFVYYSGHADDRHLHLRGEPRLSHHELQDLLRALPATVTIGVIDACKSGALTRKGGTAAPAFDVDIAASTLSGLVLLTSSGADELSQESRALTGSVFTHHLVSGLRGTADIDADQQVTLAEAYRYAYELTRADTATNGALQRPAFSYELSGQGELVLTRLATEADAQLRVPRGARHRYVVLDAHESRLIAEARPSADRDVVITLARGRYRIKRVLDDRLEVASLVLAPRDRVDLDRVTYQPAAASGGLVKGDPDNLSPAERHRRNRTRAFAVLAEDNPRAALDLFNALIRETPDDAVARRGRNRALIQIAELYRKVGDHDQELAALRDVFQSDPSLAHDPYLQRWHLSLTAPERFAREEVDRREATLLVDSRGPRRYGFGGDLYSARGLLGFHGTVVLGGIVFWSAGFTVAPPGMDVGIAVAMKRSRLSPYLGIGGHISLETLGVDLTASDDSPSRPALVGMLARHARVEVGAQYVGPSGFVAHLGLAVMRYLTPAEEYAIGVWPVVQIGWLF